MNWFPVVSVVTPSLNQGQFIDETINSVLSQNYVNVEYLVIDGGSGDSTLDILRHHAGRDARLRWVSEPDTGQSSAINKGWRMSHGEIIAWLNSDDTYLPDAISRVVKFFEENPFVDAVYGDCDYRDEMGRNMYPYPTRPYDYPGLVRTARNYIPQPATFMRRSVLESLGYLDESLSYVMDFDYWLRMGIRHRLAYIPVHLATLRLHAEAKSVKKMGEFGSELLHIYNRLFDMQDLPHAVLAEEVETMSNVYYHAASCAFWAERLDEARHLGYRAWRYSPFKVRPLLIFFALRALGLKIARKLASYASMHRNPR